MTEALGPGPVDPCLKMSLTSPPHVSLQCNQNLNPQLNNFPQALIHIKFVNGGLKLARWCVNGDRYRAMITNFFIPELNNHDVQELWLQQDGATCHTAHATIDLLKDTFGDRLISSFGPVNWPPRSCDLTPLDYFLWGYVKSLVYADKPQTLDHLEDNIRRVIADIRPQMLEKVIENWTSRLDYIRASRGSPMPGIIFKIYTRAFGDGPRNLDHGQVTWTTPEQAPPSPNYHTTPTGEDVSALDRFNVHRCPTRRVFSGTGLDPVTKQATVRYLYHSATAATAKSETNVAVSVIP
ncbi:putative DD41D transposase [Trichonephila clavipes]|nr:putative DD41D transposase [Trichonephila clavipes]